MSQGQKFQHRWEFRRRDDDFDSSGNDSKSSSSGEPVFKKHKLVSNLILPENDETSDTPGSQQRDQFEPSKADHVKFGEANQMNFGLRKKNNAVNKKGGFFKDGNKKKNKCIAPEPVSLGEFKIFMESILEELKVARENMFTRMREEMKKLVAVETASRPTRNEDSCVQKVALLKHQNSIEMHEKSQNSNGRSLEKSVKSNGMFDSNNCYEVLDEDHDPATGKTISNEKEEGGRLRFSVKRPHYSANSPDQVVSSPYLTLPTALSKQLVENHGLDSSSHNYIRPGAAVSNAGLSSERENLLINVSSHHGYLSCIQQEDHFPKMGSKNIDCFDQHISQSSSIGTGFPVPLHRGLDNNFNIPRQNVLENSYRDSNILGLRMNGGAIRSPGAGGSFTLSEHIAANNFRSHMKHKTDGGLRAFGTQDLKEGHPYLN